ncbi:MAG: hypothetical protein ACI90V_013232 [Bacillariaceae sp.]|jgi:hypothetical protein
MFEGSAHYFMDAALTVQLAPHHQVIHRVTLWKIPTMGAYDHPGDFIWHQLVLFSDFFTNYIPDVYK